jgi:hypothetical protein
VILYAHSDAELRRPLRALAQRIHHDLPCGR